MSSNDTSFSLLERAKSQDQDAWQRLVRLYGPLVYAWCRRAGLSEDDSSDVFQDVFRAVSGGLSRFKPTRETGSFRSWLRTVARTKVADHFQKAGRQPRGIGGTAANVQIGEVADPLAEDSDADIESDQAILVRRAMEMIQPEFNERTWQAFQRVAIRNEATSDVAADLEMSDQAVRQANYRVRRRLRTELQGLFDWE